MAVAELGVNLLLHTERDQALTGYRFNIGDEQVDYLAGHDCALELGSALSDRLSRFDTVLIVADSSATRQLSELLDGMDTSKIRTEVIDAAEQTKRLPAVEYLLERAVEAGLKRDSAIVAMGGGVAGNVAGMVAASLYRGIPLIHLPTTPVAAFDSVLSAKQAVNLSHGKNMVGFFHTPEFIACDLKWLETVPASQLSVGVAEMAKNVLAVVPGDADRLVSVLRGGDLSGRESLETLLDIGLAAKAPFLHIDPHERHEALIFEYGHTAGHAIEFASAGRCSHGEAVAWGMLIAAEISADLYGLSETDKGRHYELFDALRVDRRHVADIDLGRVKALLRLDNKRGYLRGADSETLGMVLLQELGKPVTIDGSPLVPVDARLADRAVDRVLGPSV